MALALDELVRKANTTVANVQPLINQVWAPKVERNLRKKSVFLDSLVVNNSLMVPNSGDTVYIPLLPDLGPSAPLTENVDMVDVALTGATVVPMVPAEVGSSVGITRKALDRLNYNGIEEIIDRLSYAMAQKMNNDVAALWNATVAGSGNGQSMTVQYPNAHISTTVVATDTLSDVVILTALATLLGNNAETWDDGYFRMYINPNQLKQLIRDTDIRQDLRFASPQRLINGEIGALHGIRMIVTNYLVTATENTISVVKSLLLTPRWAFIAYKRMPEVVVDPTVYDFGRRRRMAIVADYAVNLVHFERGVVVTTANV